MRAEAPAAIQPLAQTFVVKYHVYNATSGRYTSRAHDTQLNRGHSSAAKVRRMRGGRSRPLGHASSRGGAERVAAKALDVLEGVASVVNVSC